MVPGYAGVIGLSRFAPDGTAGPWEWFVMAQCRISEEHEALPDATTFGAPADTDDSERVYTSLDDGLTTLHLDVEIATFGFMTSASTAVQNHGKYMITLEWTENVAGRFLVRQGGANSNDGWERRYPLSLQSDGAFTRAAGNLGT